MPSSWCVRRCSPGCLLGSCSVGQLRRVPRLVHVLRRACARKHGRAHPVRGVALCCMLGAPCHMLACFAAEPGCGANERAHRGAINPRAQRLLLQVQTQRPSKHAAPKGQRLLRGTEQQQQRISHRRLRAQEGHAYACSHDAHGAHRPHLDGRLEHRVLKLVGQHVERVPEGPAVTSARAGAGSVAWVPPPLLLLRPWHLRATRHTAAEH